MDNTSINPVFDKAQVKDAYHFYSRDGQWPVEIRHIPDLAGTLRIVHVTDETSFVTCCERANASGGVYAGVQPRRSNHSPRNAAARDDDIETLSSIVIDLDAVRPKNTQATKDQIRRTYEVAVRIADWLEAKGFIRPMIVHSGNGYHIYIAVPPLTLTAENRAEVAARVKDFESRIRAKFATPDVAVDSIANFSRVIRVPGTANLKGSGAPGFKPRLCSALTGFQRQEDPEFLEALLSIPLSKDAASASTSSTGPVIVDTNATTLSPWAATFLKLNPSIDALFHGQGKTSGDRSSSGYDSSLAHAALQRRLSPSQVATLLFHRPDGRARAKGENYIQRTVQKAAQTVEAGRLDEPRTTRAPAKKVSEADVDFVVSKIVVYQAMPVIVELTIRGKVLRLGMPELMSGLKFSQRFAERFLRIPRLPGKNSSPSWTDHVNQLLEKAEIVQQPVEANDQVFVQEEVLRVLEGLLVGHTLDDLNHGKGVVVDGRVAFRLRTVSSIMAQTNDSVAPSLLAVLLRKLGCEPGRPSVDGQQVRIWYAPPQQGQPDAPAKAPETLDTIKTEGVSLTDRYQWDFLKSL